MPKTVQIRDIDDEVYEGLRHHADFLGLSVPEFLRREATRLAQRMTMEEWLARVSQRTSAYSVTRDHINEVLDELRGPWPDVGS